jgi:hypothetical protein
MSVKWLFSRLIFSKTVRPATNVYPERSMYNSIKSMCPIFESSVQVRMRLGSCYVTHSIGGFYRKRWIFDKPLWLPLVIEIILSYVKNALFTTNRKSNDRGSSEPTLGSSAWIIRINLEFGHVTFCVNKSIWKLAINIKTVRETAKMWPPPIGNSGCQLEWWLTVYSLTSSYIRTVRPLLCLRLIMPQ